MAQERIIIVVEERGTRRVQQQIRDVGQSAQRSSTSVDFLRRAVLGLGAAATIRAAIGLADSFTQITNQIRIATGGIGSVTQGFDRLREISNATRTPLEANVALFQRASIAADELGATQEELFTLVELVGQGLAIQGGSAAAASGALIQLSQALGSGVVRAEEFNSILEGAFPIAQAAARGLEEAGGSVARLRTLIIEGQVTSDEFFRSLLSQADELESVFAVTVPTVGQAFTVLRNNLIAFVGQLDDSLGVTNALSQSLIFLSNNLDAVQVSVVGVGVSIVALRFGPLALEIIQAARASTLFSVALARVRIAINAVTAAIAANPIGFFVVGLTAGIVALVTFREEIFGFIGSIDATSDGLVSVRDVAVAAFETIRDAARVAVDLFVRLWRGAVDFFRQNFSIIGDVAGNVFGEFTLSIEDVTLLAARAVDNQIGIWLGLFNVIRVGVTTVRQVFGDQINAIVSLVEGTINALIAAVRVAIGAVVQFVNELIESANRALRILGRTPIAEVVLGGFEGVEVQRFAGEAGEAARLGAEFIRDSFLEGFNQTFVEDAVTGIFDRAREIAAERTMATDVPGVADADVAPLVPEVDPEVLAALRQVNDDLANQARLLGLSNRERQIAVDLQRIQQQLAGRGVELTTDEAASVEGRLRENQALADQRAVLDRIRGPQEALEDRQQATNDLFNEGAISAEDYAEQIRQINSAALQTDRTLRGGFARGLDTVTTQIINFSDQAERTIVNAFNNAENALVQFVQTGEADFSRLVDSILADLTRLAIRQSLFALLGAAGAGQSGAAGGANILVGAVANRQIGGPVGANQPVIVGENGPELFRPTVPGNITPSTPTQQMIGRPIQVVIVNQTSDDDVLAVLDMPEADEIIFNKIERNPRRVRASIGEGG